MPNRRAVSLAAALCLLAAAAQGCAAQRPPNRRSLTEDRLEDMQQQIYALRQKQIQLEDSVSKLAFELERQRGAAPVEVSALPAPSSPPPTEDLPAPAAGMKAESVPAPREKTGGEPAAAAQPPPEPRAQAAPAEAPPTPVQPRSPMPAFQDPAQLYGWGYAQFRQDRFEEAEAAFTGYLEQEPGGNLAGNALYWRAECRFSRGMVKESLSDLDLLLETFPDGVKAPEALFKKGLIYRRMNLMESARRSWELLLERYPGSEAALRAEPLIEELAS